MKKDNLRHVIASHETAPLTIKSKSGLSAEGVAVLRSKTQKPVNRRQPSSAVSVYDCSSVATLLPTLGSGGGQFNDTNFNILKLLCY